MSTAHKTAPTRQYDIFLVRGEDPSPPPGAQLLTTYDAAVGGHWAFQYGSIVSQFEDVSPPDGVDVQPGLERRGTLKNVKESSPECVRGFKKILLDHMRWKTSPPWKRSTWPAPASPLPSARSSWSRISWSHPAEIRTTPPSRGCGSRSSGGAGTTGGVSGDLPMRIASRPTPGTGPRTIPVQTGMSGLRTAGSAGSRSRPRARRR